MSPPVVPDHIYSLHCHRRDHIEFQTFKVFALSIRLVGFLFFPFLTIALNLRCWIIQTGVDFFVFRKRWSPACSRFRSIVDTRSQMRLNSQRNLSSSTYLVFLSLFISTLLFHLTASSTFFSEVHFGTINVLSWFVFFFFFSISLNGNSPFFLLLHLNLLGLWVSRLSRSLIKLVCLS